MGKSFWIGACFTACFCCLGTASAQEPAATHCAVVAKGAPVVATAEASKPGCPPVRDDLSDTNKALGVALLGCAIAFASHVARRRSAKVVLS